MSRRRLDESEIEAVLATHHAWRREGERLVRVVDVATYQRGVDLVVAQAEAAERLDHHASVTLDVDRVRFEVWTHDRGGITERDVDFVDEVDRLVALSIES
ncbi:MAG: 4a-hydroxytetrahydrobiopterin dehydratase [Acidobacteriota bacterium]|nr:4a-hydroxytetrahydrobiopterin dehydratase [Acidobacteriota bacterium]